MPTVLRLGRKRVMIYTNDHLPPHVHVWEGTRQAVFNLNCSQGPLELRENFGFSWPEVNALAALLKAQRPMLCARWRSLHGER